MLLPLVTAALHRRVTHGGSDSTFFLGPVADDILEL